MLPLFFYVSQSDRNGIKFVDCGYCSRERSWAVTMRGAHVLRVYTRRWVGKEGEWESKGI